MAKITKKTTAKKTTAKAPAKKMATAEKAANTRAKPETVQAKLTPIKATAAKRTPGIPAITINRVIGNLASVKADLDNYAAHLRALDRKRLQSIGTRKEGFAQLAYRLAMDNPEFLPNYLAQDRYTDDFDHFLILQTAVNLEKQVNELLKNINIECMDYFYTDGLDFYASVREAAKRRVDAAETIYTELFDTYFKKMDKKTGTEPTEKQQLKDAKAIIRSTKEGKIEAVNIKPKAAGGIHKVIDEKFEESGKFKETEEGEIDN
jgi:hypothetical protein